MRPLCARLFAVCLLLLGAAGTAAAGGIHIRYGPDAPEKLADSNILYYEGVLNLEQHHPREFAEEHPFYTKMFDDSVMLDKLMARWEAHEERFEYWHNCLWKVLDGYRASHPDLAQQLTLPVSVPPIEVGPGGPSNIGQSLPAGPQYGNPPGGGGSNGSGGGTSVQAVPEPSSAMLMVLGVALAGSCAVFRRARRQCE
jgi:PEP-CTERM motif